jgi:hypothetical protein
MLLLLLLLYSIIKGIFYFLLFILLWRNINLILICDGKLEYNQVV